MDLYNIEDDSLGNYMPGELMNEPRNGHKKVNNIKIDGQRKHRQAIYNPITGEPMKKSYIKYKGKDFRLRSGGFDGKGNYKCLNIHTYISKNEIVFSVLNLLEKDKLQLKSLFTQSDNNGNKIVFGLKDFYEYNEYTNKFDDDFFGEYPETNEWEDKIVELFKFLGSDPKRYDLWDENYVWNPDVYIQYYIDEIKEIKTQIIKPQDINSSQRELEKFWQYLIHQTSSEEFDELMKSINVNPQNAKVKGWVYSHSNVVNATLYFWKRTHRIPTYIQSKFGWYVLFDRTLVKGATPIPMVHGGGDDIKHNILTVKGETSQERFMNANIAKMKDQEKDPSLINFSVYTGFDVSDTEFKEGYRPLLQQELDQLEEYNNVKFVKIAKLPKVGTPEFDAAPDFVSVNERLFKKKYDSFNNEAGYKDNLRGIPNDKWFEENGIEKGSDEYNSYMNGDNRIKNIYDRLCEYFGKEYNPKSIASGLTTYDDAVAEMIFDLVNKNIPNGEKVNRVNLSRCITGIILTRLNANPTNQEFISNNVKMDPSFHTDDIVKKIEKIINKVLNIINRTDTIASTKKGGGRKNQSSNEGLFRGISDYIIENEEIINKSDNVIAPISISREDILDYFGIDENDIQGDEEYNEQVEESIYRNKKNFFELFERINRKY